MPRQTLTPVRKAIRLLMNFPEIGHLITVDTALSELQQHGVAFLLELLEYVQSRSEGSTTTANIIEHWRDTPIEKALLELNQSEELLHDAEAAAQEFQSIMQKLLRDDQTQKRKQQNQQLTSIQQLKQQRQNKE